ncbi:DUF2090 domain-containing protein [Patescibacteria group bacterium]|nr:DUF2090 domain-containing protein [Patescibacteria group bacterium]
MTKDIQPVYTILALDHRSSLRRLMSPQSPDKVSADELIYFKKLALKTLLPYVSHVLIDPDSGLPALKTIGQYQAKVIMSIEKSGYSEREGGRLNELLNTVEELKAQGTDIVKLLIYFNHRAKPAIYQKELITKVSSDCKAQNLPFLLEPISYALPHQDDFDCEQEVLDTAKDIVSLNCSIDIYKTAFPGNNNCQELTSIMGNIPWVLLSGGDDFDEYQKLLSIAVAGGASGFAAGRALWQDFVKYPKEEWEGFFENTVKKRLKEIVGIVENYREL